MSIFKQALKLFNDWRMPEGELTSEELEAEGYDYEYEEAPDPAPAPYGGKHSSPRRPERAEYAGLCIVRADPKNMEQATKVADEIKRRRPVLLNLQAAAEPEAKRIRDFLAGVTYGLNGYMRRIADWVFVCAPFDMPVEKLALEGPHTGEPRYEESDHRSIQEL